MATFPTDVTYSGYTLTNRKPDRDYDYNREIKVEEFESEAGYSVTRLLNRRGKRSWSFTYSAINGYYKTAIENFFKARNGRYESFTFDLSYLGESGTTTVRFDMESLEIRTRMLASTELKSVYSVSLKLKEI